MCSLFLILSGTFSAMMEVRRRRTRPQDVKHGTHVENDANATINQSRDQRDEVSRNIRNDFLGAINLECSYEKKKKNYVHIRIREYILVAFLYCLTN